MTRDNDRRFHPAWLRFKEIIDSGELGKVKSITAALQFPSIMNVAADDDIRFKYDLGGGIMMDMGCESLIAISLANHPDRTLRLSPVRRAVPHGFRTSRRDQSFGDADQMGPAG